MSFCRCNEDVIVKIKKWTENSKLPTMPKNGDAGVDCYIRCFKSIQKTIKATKELNYKKYTLKPLERVLCGLGFATEIPKGCYAKVVPRSGNALWNGLTILNTPGTIDCGYRNEWGAIVVNLSNESVELKTGDKICQFIVRKLVDHKVKFVETLNESSRGKKGFGSSGK